LVTEKDPIPTIAALYIGREERERERERDREIERQREKE
jgi:hypothetical protein